MHGSCYENANIYLGSLSGAFSSPLCPAHDKQGSGDRSREACPVQEARLPGSQSLMHNPSAQTLLHNNDLLCISGIGLSLDGLEIPP